jgi:hypothetical protein
MGARHSRSVVQKLAQEEPALRNQVMEYLQQFDRSHSKAGFLNRRQGVIDVISMQQIRDSKQAMQGLVEIFENYQASHELTTSQETSEDGSENFRRSRDHHHAFAASNGLNQENRMHF